MSKLIWDEVGKKMYETGVDNGVLYIQDANGAYPLGVAWNGLVAVTESPSGAEATSIYADNIKYLSIVSAEEFGATVEAYTYPEEFEACEGLAEVAPGVSVGQQARKTFGMVYRTIIGNDIDLDAHGYKIHLIYGGMAAPSEKAYQTVNDSPEAITFSWELSTTPVPVPGKKPTAYLVIDSTKVDAAKLKALEDILFGTVAADPRLPMPAEVIALFEEAAPDAVALSSIVPADNANGIAVDSNIVLTFNNKILRETIIVTSAAGVIVPVTKTWDATGKILTINPSDNLTGNTTYIVAISGVVDVYGDALAADAKNFTTVAG